MQFETALLAILASSSGVDAAGRVFASATSTVGGRVFATAGSTAAAGSGATPWYCAFFPTMAGCKPVTTTTTSSTRPATVGTPTGTTTNVNVPPTTTPATTPTTTAPPSTPTTLQQSTPTPASVEALSFPYKDQQPFVDSMLSTHNAYRARHGVAPLTWSTTLSTQALNWANGRSWSHTPNNANGENLATGTYTNPAYYVFMWYDEVRQYSYSNPGFFEATGHFTQVVWNSTTQVGCAMTNTATTQLPTYTYYLVCEYSPPGNIVNAGYFANNVYQPVSQAYPAAPAQFL